MLQAATFEFLQGVQEHNNREWFLENKSRYERARQDVHELARQLIAGIAAFDPTIPSDLDPKLCVMRIYRDVRFSKDKSPYKENFAISISPKGKNFDGPGYYLHIHPSASLLAGGYWMPGSDELKAIRQEIDYNGDDFRAVIQDPDFLNYFGSLNTIQSLKTVPKGYDAHHPDIQWLKLKSFTADHALSMPDLTQSVSAENLIKGFEKLYPLMCFLRNALS
ncbi:MAG: hypothetical protein RI924_301 [Bacteroidota bacterium]|jgi:uncharacterized protein (TIGR02453 family)